MPDSVNAINFAPVETLKPGQTAESAKPRVPKQDMDKEMFLKLLVTQMRYQDPNAPMDTNQMMQQTQMLTLVEKIMDVAKSSRANFEIQQRGTAFGLVGHEVTFTEKPNPERAWEPRASHAGVVTQVRIDGDQTLLKINGIEVSMDMVTGVSTTAGAIVKPPAQEVKKDSAATPTQQSDAAAKNTDTSNTSGQSA